MTATPTMTEAGPAPTSLAKLAKHVYSGAMTTMNVSLPDNLKDFVDEQVEADGYASSSEYIRMLIRRERDQKRMRDLLLEGAASPQGEPVTPEYFEALREHVRATSATRA